MSSRKIWHINPTLFGIVKKDQNIGARYGLGASFVGLLLHEQVIYPLCSEDHGYRILKHPCGSPEDFLHPPDFGSIQKSSGISWGEF